MFSMVLITVLVMISIMFITTQSFRFSMPAITRKGLTLDMLKVGDIAPDFLLANAEGKTFQLSSYKGKKPVVIFFYPADNSPGCTKEVCAFEKKAPDFKAKGAEVFGIASGGVDEKKKFITKNNLQKTELLIDAKNTVRTSWEVPRAAFDLLPGRVTYVIGKDGIVKSIYNDIANAELHPEKALETLTTLNEKTPVSAGSSFFSQFKLK